VTPMIIRWAGSCFPKYSEQIIETPKDHENFKDILIYVFYSIYDSECASYDHVRTSTEILFDHVRPSMGNLV
jgi:hypothetical protein